MKITPTKRGPFMRLFPGWGRWVMLMPLLLCPTALIRGADGTALWTNVFNGPANGSDTASYLAVDGNGNVCVTGSSLGTNGFSDYATIKYSGAGVPLWTNQYHGAATGNNYNPSGLAADANGNVYVTGGSFGNSAFADYETIKYSSAGAVLWANVFHLAGNNNAYAQGVAVDGDGNVIVTGYSPDSAIAATVKYSSAGVLLWTNLYHGADNLGAEGYAVAVDGSGSAYVAGYSISSDGNQDFAAIKYSSAGLLLWTNTCRGAGGGSGLASAVAADGSGNAFVTGWTTGSGGNFDFTTIKYSSAGVALWTNVYNGAGNSFDQTRAVAVDAGGNVYITGSSAGIGGHYNYATIKYSSAGAPVWTNIYNGPLNSDDLADSLALDASANVYVTGYSIGNGTGYDYATIKYSTAGVALWTNRFDGPISGADQARALAVDGSGNVYVTGNSAGSGSGANFATIKYSGGNAVVPPLVIVTTNDFDFASRQFRFTLTGPAGSNAVIIASTNLQTWIALETNLLIGGSLNFTDALATNFIRRFYRAHLQ